MWHLWGHILQCYFPQLLGYGLGCSLCLFVLPTHPQSFSLGSSEEPGTPDGTTNSALLCQIRSDTMLSCQEPCLAPAVPLLLPRSVMPMWQVGENSAPASLFLSLSSAGSAYVPETTMCYWAQGFYRAPCALCFGTEWTLLTGVTSFQQNRHHSLRGEATGWSLYSWSTRLLSMSSGRWDRCLNLPLAQVAR